MDSLIRLAPAPLGGLLVFFYLGWKVERHYQAVRYFQAVRRLIEEELMRYRSMEKEPNLEEIRHQWSEALSISTPIPSKIHEKNLARMKQ